MASISQSTSRSHKKQKRKEKQIPNVEETVHSSPKKVKFEDKPPELPITPDKVSNVTLGWTSDDLNSLINNLAKCLPKNDSAKYSTLIEKLDWDKVKFGTYTAQQCKDKWSEVMNRLRRYRTLTDMVSDARVWLKAPWQTYNNSRKIKHPDLPKKPLTPFFRYFMEKREASGKKNPGASVTDLAKILSGKFASLTERKKQRYKDSYDKEYEEYKRKIEIFKREHPEVEFGSMNKTQSSHGHAQEGPPRAKTPFQLFMEEKSKKIAANSEGRKEAIDKIKQSWNQLSEGKRIKWIRRALQDEVRYETDLMEYIKEHPSFEPNKFKSVLTKSEKELKDKFDGKPERPPNSGYSLFSKILLRELKEIPAKEKMVVIAKRWKELSETERLGYNREAQKQNTKYVEKFNVYLDSLPESEKEKVLSENKLKLPSEKKLKQQQSLPKLTTPLVPEPIEDPWAKEQAAILNYQLDRVPELQEKYPEKTRLELMKISLQEWGNKLNDKKKSKYYKQSESFAQLLPSSKADGSGPAKHPKEKPSPAQQNLMKREPKRPPKSGYALFTSEQLSSLTDFEPKKRMQEIARKWNQELTKEDKENYDIRIKEMNAEYQKKLLKFTATLNPTELIEYNGMKNQSRPKSRPKSKSAKSIADPVVDDSNVIETVDISTSGDAANTSDDDSEEEDSENEGSEEAEEEEEEEGEEEEEEEEGEEEEETPQQQEEAEDSDDESEEEDEDEDDSSD